jgi:hypothetical protein
MENGVSIDMVATKPVHYAALSDNENLIHKLQSFIQVG